MIHICLRAPPPSRPGYNYLGFSNCLKMNSAASARFISWTCSQLLNIWNNYLGLFIFSCMIKFDETNHACYEDRLPFLWSEISISESRRFFRRRSYWRLIWAGVHFQDFAKHTFYIYIRMVPNFNLFEVCDLR